jgi:hypothetical protein
MAPAELVDNGGNEARADGDRAPDPDVARPRIGEEFELLHRLIQRIERAEAAIEKRASIDRRFDALRTAIEKTHAHGMLEIGDRFRNNGSRDGKVARGL